MKISIITLFPEVFEPILNTSILKRAQNKDKVTFELINLRDFGKGRHKVVDDKPYGGGAGMILKADVLAQAITSAYQPRKASPFVRILMSASGKPYKQADAKRLSKFSHLIIICGHYEGVDQRFVDKYVDEEISIGDYVLTGGEIPAMAIVDSIVRLIPGVLEKPESIQDESFSTFHSLDFSSTSLTAGARDRHPSSNFQTLEYPQYTRPEVFDGEKVPEVLLSGNHKEIEKWRKEQAIEKTKKLRPDLITQKD